jgi:hypothetical protein
VLLIPAEHRDLSDSLALLKPMADVGELPHEMRRVLRVTECDHSLKVSGVKLAECDFLVVLVHRCHFQTGLAKLTRLL